MKKWLSLFIFCCVLTLCSCGFVPGNNNGNATSNPTIKNTEVFKYQEKINVGDEYDESSVYVRVVFSDNTSNVYRNNKLEFDYSDFDFDTPGVYELKITIKELKVTTKVSVTVTGSGDSNVTVKEVTVTEYQKSLEAGEMFDEESVYIAVGFTNGDYKVYCGDDLSFDYSDVDFDKVGTYTIKVKIDDLDITEEIEIKVTEKNVKILMIANSYGDDTVQWVHEISDSLGINITIANLYIGGCVLETHLNNLNYNKPAYEYVVYNKNTRTWSRQANTSIATALTYEDWDYISLQQGSSQSGLADTYDLIDSVMDMVLEIKSDVKFLWNMTWAYQQNSGHGSFGNYNNDQMTMYNSIINAVQTKVVPNDRFDFIVPNGTAVQNARTSFIGDNLCRDVHCHLSYDFGRYIAGLGMVATVTGADISNIAYAPAGVNEEYKKIAIESVLNALEKPFEITPSKYAEDKTMDLTDYVEIDYEPVGCAYWHSSATNFDKLVTNAENSIKFVASKRFTKDELPVGSIIEIKAGYQYRPEAWLDDATQESRPDNTNVKYIEVTEEWWGNYKYRAFNISSTANSDLTFAQKDAIEAFSIYVPKDKYQAPTGNPYASGDTALFTSNGLNINNYEMYDYNYSNGFYNSGDTSNPLDFHYYDKPEANNFCHKFICTEGFDKEKLPVGSVIIIDSGYQYRPDGWTGNTKNTSRPGNVTTNFVVVDDAWWGDYVVRGFNLSSTSGTAINQIPYEATAHLRIYIPSN